MRKLITAATVLTLLGEPAAQEPVRNRILTDTDGRAIVWATDMPLHALVLKLARSARVRLVFEGEADADGSTSPDHAVPLDGRTLGEALDAIVRIDARYRWREQDGVVILRPVRQWGDSENPLNQVVGPVAWVGITASQALDRVRQLIFRYPSAETGLEGLTSGGDGRQFSVVTRQPKSILDVIVEVSRAHGELMWSFPYDHGIGTARTGAYSFGLRTFDGQGSAYQTPRTPPSSPR